MKMHLKTHSALILSASLLAGSASAATIAFEAESGTLGSDYETVSDTNASGGSFIRSTARPNSEAPNLTSATVSYSIDFTEVGTYFVYALMQLGADDDVKDTFHYAADFGTPIVTEDADWIKVNGARKTPFLLTATDYKWVNISTVVSADGEAPVTFSVTDTGTQTWQIGAREDLFRHDAFVFSTENNLSDADLNAALIPEPGTALLGGLGMLALLRRRRN